MPNLGALWYALSLDTKQLEADLQRINNKLKDAGATITVNPVLGKTINDILPKGVDVEITPNKVAQDALDKAIEGKAMKAEILPLADKLKSAVVEALKDTVVPLNGITIPPDKITAAVTSALSSSNFTAVGEKAGDELTKAIKVKVEGQTYHATVSAKTDKLTDTVTKALDKILSKEQKIKLDKSDIRAFRDELKNKISESVKVTPTLNVTQEALQRAVEGKVMRVEIMPLVTNLRKNIKDAFAGNPAEIEVGANAAKLRDTVTRVLLAQGYMVNISTVTGLEKSITTQLNGRVYNVRIRANATEIANSVQASLMQVQSRTFGLTVAKDVLHKSIDDALIGKPFHINIAVHQDQARKAVQDALLRAQIMGKDQALAYQRLQTGELRAAQAELARLRAEQLGAAKAANTHASASINLGGALGSNIKIAGELGAAMASLYSVHAAKQFLSQVIEIGGELEHQKIALETIYGTPSKMESLYGNIKSLARQSPFGVMELTKNVKQLSAYGVAYNEVYDTAKRLADISAATSVDIQRLILAFGKTKNRTFLDGLEAKQFAYANIPIYDALSKKLTELEGKFVSVKDVMGRIKKREIGFDMVKDILWDMTDEGGKFYNMQEKLADSLLTSKKLIKDNFELMLGEIAESSAGDAMKTFFQFIQKLTREWKTLFAVVASGAGIFGIYKLAVFATNVMMGRMNAANLAQIQSQAKLNASLAQTATMYRGLSAEESKQIMLKSTLDKVNSKNIFSNKALTSAEIKLLVAEKALTRDSAARVIAMGKISPIQARYLVQQKLITVGDLRAAVAARKHGLSLNILGKDVKIASFRFKMLGAAVWSSVKALGAMVVNPLTAIMAAVGAGMALWSRNNEEMEKAKEIGEGMFTKAADGAKELDDILKGMKPAENMNAAELMQNVEKLKEAIKDYAINPIEDINKSLYDQNGLLLPLQQQYENLLDKLKSLKAEFDLITEKNIGQAVGNAIADSNGGIFNDDVNTNAKDYDKALKEQSDAIRKYISDNAIEAQKAVKEAMDHSEAFKIAAGDMRNWQAQFAELVKNRERYGKDLVGLIDINEAINKGGGSKLTAIRSTWETLVDDMKKAWESLNADAKLKDLIGDEETIKDATDEIREAYALSLAEWIRNLEVSDELKQKMRGFYGDLLGIDMQGIDWELRFSENLERQLADNKPELFSKLKKGITLSEDEKAELKNQAVVSYNNLFRNLSDELKTSLQDSFTVFGENGNRGLDFDKAFRVSARMYLLADEEQWKQEIDRAASNLPEVQTWLKGAADTQSFIKAVKEGYKAAKDGLDDLQKRTPLELKGSVSFDISNLQAIPLVSKQFSEASALTQQWITEYNQFVATVNAARKAGESMSFDPAETKKSSSSSDGRPHRDMLASKFKEEFADLRDGWAEVQKLADSLGIDAAFRKVEQSSLFGHFDWGNGPKSFEDYRKALVDLRQRLYDAGIKGHPERETLFNDLTKKIFEVDRTLLERNIQDALDAVSQELQRQTADWSLFDKIRKATGNQDLAVSIAFGLDSDAETDYPALVRHRYDRIAEEVRKVSPKADIFMFDDVTQANLSKMPKELQKAYKEARTDLMKYAREQKDAIADILNEYQSLSDKLAKIDADRDRKLKTIRESDMSEADKAKYIQRINVEADYQKFTQSNEYLQFFGGIYALTMSQAQQIGDLIEENLNRKLQAGSISAEDYYKEIERVRQQLDKLRNIKSNALTFMTEGFKGLNKKEWEKNEAERLKASQKVEKLEENLAKVKANGNMYEIQSAEAQLEAAKKELAVQDAIRKKLVENQQWMENTLGVVNVIANIAGGMSDAFNTLRDMADSFGFDTDSNAWNTAASVMDTLTTVTGGVQKVLQGLMSGDIGGVISGVFDTLLSPITIWNKLHDKKLDKMIEKSKEAAQIMQNQYDILEKQMANFLGNAALMRTGTLGGGYGKQRELMQGQLAELQKQRQAEIDKKKTDDSVVRDYEQQIDEMKIQIRDFALEVAKDLYGIDLNSWAEQLGDALVDAFATGEDAAEAFDKTVGDIMRDVTSKMISQDILAPMFGDLRDYLFGKDGTGGAFGSDFQLDPSEMGAMKEYLDKIKNEGIPAAQELFDAINNATGGMLNDTEKSKSGTTKGLQSLTENTGDLLASYVNGIRGDTSVIRLNWDKLMESALPQMNVIAEAQLTAQRQIAENTLRNAIAAEAIRSSAELMAKYSKSIDDRLRRAQADKSMGFYLR
ncbi:MAG: hypothetical protein K2N48_01585 [Muribaculaceae bacterium]|nr:hypothetical protein [Muribaculaceae bacterium]